MRKVLGFDSWTGGAHHYQRLINALREEGFELVLVHIGSWGSDKGRPATEVLGALPVKEISAYRRQCFTEILDEERPSAVIFLSTDTFAHRAFNRYCRVRRIPTVNLYHGLVTVQAVDEGSPYRLNLIAHLRFVGARILKALTLVWPTYAKALWRTGARLEEWRRFASDIIKGGLGKFSLESAADARTTMCCVYVPADVDHAIRKYGFEPHEVVAVGNPDLIRFGVRPEWIGACDLPTSTGLSDVMYVDTGLVYTGFVFDSANEFITHLLETQRQLERAGRRLLFKPHPDHMRTDLPKRLEEAGIGVCSNDDFVERLRGCCACIVEPSTVAVVPALLGMPLLLANYGKLAGQRFGRVLRSYPRARVLRELGEFEAVVQSVRDAPEESATLQWIERNSGPIPAEHMPKRVARVVAELVSRDSE